MKKLMSLFSFLILNVIVMSSQTVNELITLDRYLVPKNKAGAVVGKVYANDTKKVELIKDASGLFTVNKNGEIQLKKGKMLTDSSPISYEITLRVGDKVKSFELVKDDFIRNKVVAHRGAWKNQDASQNSLKSLKKAIELGCEGSEFDVWLSSDNEVVLSHDPIIDGKTVEDTPAAELFKIEMKDGDHLPSLKEYIECIKAQNKTKLVLEVKASLKGKERCEAVADSSVQIVHRMNAQGWVDYITFNFDAAKRIRELDPTACILYLEADKSLEELKAEQMSGIDYHFSQFQKDKELAAKAHKLGLLTNAWTVNKEEVLKEMLNLNLDYITTDEPELLLQMIDNSK